MTSQEQDPLLLSSDPTVSSPFHPPGQARGQKEVCGDRATRWRRDNVSPPAATTFLQAHGCEQSTGQLGERWEEEAEISDAPGFSGSRTRPFQEPLLPLPAVSVLGSRSERWAHGLQEEEAKVWTKGS